MPPFWPKAKRRGSRGRNKEARRVEKLPSIIIRANIYEMLTMVQALFQAL